MRLVLTSNPCLMLTSPAAHTWPFFTLPYYVNFMPVCNREQCTSALIKMHFVVTHVRIVLLEVIDY